MDKLLDKRKIDVVIASNTKINEQIAKKYETEEQTDPVRIDYEEIDKLNIELIEDDLVVIKDNMLRHNSLKLSALIFNYVLRK